ncbi:MAG: response regulator transcription factor [Dehalococcoidia bacterium]
MTTIAVIEGHDEHRHRLARILRADGMDVLEAENGLDALRSAFMRRPDAALVDLDTAGMEGVELVRILRAACDIPIIALIRESVSTDVVRALDAGADDVIEKQCPAIELLARVHAAVRRYQRRRSQTDTTRLAYTGNLVIDREAQIVTKRGQALSLTRTEYRLIDTLAAHLGEIVPHRQLLSTVWGEEYVDDTHYVRVYVGYLRNKIEDDPAVPRYVLTEWGVGYRLARVPIQDEVTESGAALAVAVTA